MIKKLLLGLLLACAPALAQVSRTFVAQETNNILVGQNQFQNVTCFGSFCMDASGNATTPFSSVVPQGTQPFSVSSTTLVPNLNAALLQGCSWSISCALGTSSPNSGFFTDLHANSLSLTGTGGINAQSRWFSVTITNNNSPGTAFNKLVTLDGAGNAVTAADGQASGVIGPCVSNCGTTGQAEVVVLGFTPVVSDNAVSNGDWLVAGTSGQVHDAGAARPSGGQVVGRAQGAQPTPGQVFQALVNPDAVGSGNSSTYTLNGILYGNGTTAIQVTAAGGGGTQCLVETGGGTPAWGSCAGSAATAWSALTNPSGNLALNMGAFTTTFTYGAATGAGVDMFKITDTTNNNGTGYAFRVSLASGSAAKPVGFDVNGNGVSISNGGVLAKAGTGSVLADSTSLNINTTAPLGGGGLFNANRTLTCTTCVTSPSSIANHQVVLGADGLQGTKSLGSVGASGQVLTSGGAGVDPSWTSVGGTGTVTATTNPLVAGNPIYGNGGTDIYSSPAWVDATQMAGADMCAKIATAFGTLPSAGGTVDARGFVGNQACASNPFAPGGTEYNNGGTLLLGSVTITTTVQWTVPQKGFHLVGEGSHTGTFLVASGGGITTTFAYTPTAGPAFSPPMISATTGGSGYTSAPSCTISGGGSPTVTATCLATISGGAVNGVFISTAGSGYTVAPSCALSGGGGTGATCTAALSGPIPNNVAQKVVLAMGCTTTSTCTAVDQFGSEITRLSVDCNSLANSIGIFTAQMQERSEIGFDNIINCRTAGVVVDQNAKTGAAGTQNTYIHDLGIEPNNNGSGAWGFWDIRGGNGVMGNTWRNITITGNGVSQPLAGGGYVSGVSGGIWEHVHCEFMADCIVYGDNAGVATKSSSFTDISLANPNTGYVIHLRQNVPAGSAEFHNLYRANTANGQIGLVLDETASPNATVTTGNTNPANEYVAGDSAQPNVTALAIGHNNDTFISKLSTGGIAIGTTLSGKDGTLQLGSISNYNGVGTSSGGVVADYAAIASGTKSAAIGSTLLLAVANQSQFGGVWMVPYYINVTSACTTGCASATVVPHISFTDNDTSSTFTVDGPSCSLTSTGACSGEIPIFPKINTNINYSTTIGGSGPPAGYVYQIRLRALKP